MALVNVCTVQHDVSEREFAFRWNNFALMVWLIRGFYFEGVVDWSGSECIEVDVNAAAVRLDE